MSALLEWQAWPGAVGISAGVSGNGSLYSTASAWDTHCGDCRIKLLGRLLFVQMSLTPWRAEKNGAPEETHARNDRNGEQTEKPLKYPQKPCPYLIWKVAFTGTFRNMRRNSVLPLTVQSSQHKHSTAQQQAGLEAFASPGVPGSWQTELSHTTWGCGRVLTCPPSSSKGYITKKHPLVATFLSPLPPWGLSQVVLPLLPRISRKDQPSCHSSGHGHLRLSEPEFTHLHRTEVGQKRI